jgi:ATPase subunit of ABC transporter with duplicated ATPase domains
LAVVLADVALTITRSSRIGLIGPNGAGKSTLLRILAGVEAPDAGAVRRTPSTASVGWLPQETATDAGGTETVRELLARRTGVGAAEARLEAAAAALAAGAGPPPPAPVPASPAGAAGAEAEYAEALEAFLSLGGPDFDARSAAVCDDVGIPPDRLDLAVSSLSGGQAARAGLAAILLSRFDVLLLDEPTNDLDFDGLARLEDFVAGTPSGMVIVSHDRAFLDRTVHEVVEIDEHDHTARSYAGGWAAYLDARRVAREHAEQDHRTYLAERDRLVARERMQREWAVKGTRRAATKPDDPDKFIRRARIDASERLAAKVRITEKRLDRLEPVAKPWEGWQLQMAFEAGSRSGDVVARLHGAVAERGSFRLGPLDVEIRWADRVAIVGPNGSGKTTLLNVLRGTQPLVAGSRSVGPSVVWGELDQRRAAFEGSQSVLDSFVAATGLLPQPARSLLAKFGIGAGHITRPASRLSPGERTRAVLASLTAAGVNCLVLDEPTNHLDLPAIEQLEGALQRYQGTLLLVTHDRRLLERVRLTHRIELG